jgi:quinol monooxygenase YgiN
MITIVAVIKVTEGNENEVEGAFRDMIKNVRSEEGTLTYTLHKSTVVPNIFMFYEQYKDDDAFNFHMGTPYMNDMFSKIGDFLDGEPSLEMYEELAKL